MVNHVAKVNLFLSLFPFFIFFDYARPIFQYEDLSYSLCWLREHCRLQSYPNYPLESPYFKALWISASIVSHRLGALGSYPSTCLALSALVRELAANMYVAICG